MAKTASVGVRLDPEIKTALQREATADGRSLSAKIARICSDWVRQLHSVEKPAGSVKKAKIARPRLPVK